MCEAIHTQLNNPVYDPGTDNRPWKEYNPEQQATIVDRWYGGFNGGSPCSIDNPFYNYVLNIINGGTIPPALQTLDIRDVAKSKFGVEGSFTVRTRFQINKSGSLRKSLIGLRG